MGKKKLLSSLQGSRHAMCTVPHRYPIKYVLNYTEQTAFTFGSIPHKEFCNSWGKPNQRWKYPHGIVFIQTTDPTWKQYTQIYYITVYQSRITGFSCTLNLMEVIPSSQTWFRWKLRTFKIVPPFETQSHYNNYKKGKYIWGFLPMNAQGNLRAQNNLNVVTYHGGSDARCWQNNYNTQKNYTGIGFYRLQVTFADFSFSPWHQEDR